MFRDLPLNKTASLMSAIVYKYPVYDVLCCTNRDRNRWSGPRENLLEENGRSGQPIDKTSSDSGICCLDKYMCLTGYDHLVDFCLSVWHISNNKLYYMPLLIVC